MTGSTFHYKTKEGKRWAYSVYAGKKADGKPDQRVKRGFKTKREADDAAADLIAEIRSGKGNHNSSQQLAAFFEAWLPQHAKIKPLSPITAERYEELFVYLSDAVKQSPLRSLSVSMLEAEFARLLKCGGMGRRSAAYENPNSATKKRGLGSPLSAKTVRNIAGVLSTALGAAVRRGLLVANPIENCSLPSVQPHEARALNSHELDFFFEAAKGTYLHPIMLFIRDTAVRRGEALAVQWTDYNPVERYVWIRKSLCQTLAGLTIKGTKSNKWRKVFLSQMTVDALEAQRAEQQKRREEYAGDYRKDLDLIFADDAGDFLKPDTVTAKACLIASNAGLHGVGLHSLRHSHASHLLSEGVALPVVSKRLGHANPSITARVYSHALPDDEREVADIWQTRFERETKQ